MTRLGIFLQNEWKSFLSKSLVRVFVMILLQLQNDLFVLFQNIMGKGKSDIFYHLNAGFLLLKLMSIHRRE